MKHRAGFVNIIGNPNVGKSTLMNALMGEKLCIVTNKAQTTRHRILGIISQQDFQVVLSDTPGVIKPAYALQKSMMSFVKTALQDADVIMYMTTPEETVLKDETLFEKINKSNIPKLVLLNKIDLVDEPTVKKAVLYWQKKIPSAEIFAICALSNLGTDSLLKKIVSHLPEGPAFYPKDQFTDKPERFFVNECVREKILKHYKKEIPYAVEVVTNDFIEEDDLIKIETEILVARNSQKGIIVGHKGLGVTRIGTEARKDLEKFFNKKIFLKLFVKVDKNWRENPKKLKAFGYEN